MCLTATKFGFQEENINIYGYHRKRERQMDRKREEEGGRVVLNEKEDKSLMDVENVETIGDRWCHLSCRTPLNSSVCTFSGMKHISPRSMYIIPMYLRLTTLTKTLPQMSFHQYFLLFLFRDW